MTLGENISISDVATTEPEQQQIAAAAAKKADLGVAPKIFPRKYKTMLSREFDGVELSGGQWQRLAIARGFYRAHNLIVLDGPTAAIHPIEEARIYRQFAEMSQEKTAIIVTHRLGAAKIADRIVVMDAGRIADVVTHEDLLLATVFMLECIENR